MLRLPDAKGWMQNTFYIYAIHFMIVRFGNKVAHSVLGDSMYVGGVAFVILPIIVVVFCRYTSRLLAKYTPLMWKVISGNR